MRTRRPIFYRALATCAVATMALGTTPVYATTPGVSIVAADEQSNATLKVATSGFVDSFNPFTAIYLLPTDTIRYMYEYLVQYSAEDGSTTGGLAESWDTSEDGKTWTYHLRDNLKWSDDEPLTSQDVKWTLEQLMNVPEMGTANGAYVTSFESVDAPDDQTVVIHLKEAQAANPGHEIPIVPKHVWENIDNPADFANDKDVVGSGPYILTNYSANQKIELKANPNYWRGEPKIDGIQYIYYTDSDAQVQALRSGDVDMISRLSPTQYKAIEGAENITTNNGMGRRYMSLSINPGFQTRDGEAFGTGAEALKDVTVRQAIRQGIDLDTLLSSVLDGLGAKGTSFIPASFEKWTLPEDDSVIKGYDPDAAKKLLEDAGYVAGSDGIREKDGERLSFTLLVDSSSPEEQSIGEYLVPWMKEIGIELNIESTDSDSISSRTLVGDYDMYFSGWSQNPDPDYQLGINTCAQLPTSTDGSGGTTQDGYCDPEFDKLYQQQHVEQDETKRQEIVKQMLEMNYEATPQVTLWYEDTLEAYNSSRFTNFTKQPAENGIIAFQSGNWGYQSVETASSATASESSSKTGLWIGAGVAVLAAIAGAFWAGTRRKSTDDIE